MISGFGAMEAVDNIVPVYFLRYNETILESNICVIDVDLLIDTISYVSRIIFDNRIPLWYNPSDLRKCTRVIGANSLTHIKYLSPNMNELFTLFKHLFKNKTQVPNEKHLNKRTKTI